MGRKVIDVLGPEIGQNKNTPWAKFTPGSVIATKNVVPFDGTYRRRHSQRSGFKVAFTPALAPGFPVRLLKQVNIVPQAGDLLADPLAFLGQFTNYSIYYIVGGIPSVEGGQTYTNHELIQNTAEWVVSERATDALNTINTAFTGTSAHLEWDNTNELGGFRSTTTANTVAAQYNKSLTLGEAYIVTADFPWETPATARKGSIFIRRNDADPTNCIIASFDVNSVGVGTVTLKTGGGTLLGTSASGAIDEIVRIVVRGDSISVGGTDPSTPYLTVQSEVGRGYGGVGFAMPFDQGRTHVRAFNVAIQANAAVARSVKLVAVAKGNIYVGSPAGLTLATNGTGALSDTVTPGFAVINTDCYFADGVRLKKLDMLTNTVSSVTATAGTLPVGCSIATAYRGRLVLSGNRTDPENIFASKVGDPTKWDYSEGTPDSAFAGNTGNGRIAGPVKALVPLNDDLMLIAGESYLSVMRGDIADGGSVDLVSDAAGFYGPDAWVKSPDGVVYFVGAGGVWKFVPGQGPPQPVSQKSWDEYFAKIERGSRYITMAWDRDRQGAMLFLSAAVGSGGTDAHLWFDQRTETFFQQTFAGTLDPFCTVVYDGDGRDDRRLLTGCRDGLIRAWDRTATNDSGTAIDSYLTIGPVRFDGLQEKTLEFYDLTLGLGDDTYFGNVQVNLDVLAAPTEEMLAGDGRYMRTTAHAKTGRQSRRYLRSTGNVFAFRLKNNVLDAGWSIEKLTAAFNDAGMVRRP